MSTFNFKGNVIVGPTIGETITQIGDRGTAIDPKTLEAILRDAKAVALSEADVRDLLARPTDSAGAAKTTAARDRLFAIARSLGDTLQAYPGLVLLIEHVRRLFG